MLTAIIVDDDESIATLGAMLGRLGYVVHLSHEPERALAMVRSTTFDVAVLDVDLGDGRTSTEVADELVRHGTPILILTGLDQPDLSMLPEGVVAAFLTKPATQATIGTTLELLRKQARSQLELLKVRHLLAESQRLAAVGSFCIDGATGEHTWTDETYVLLGVNRTTFVPTMDNLLSLVHFDDRELVALALRSAMPSSTQQIELSIVRPDGACRRLSCVIERRAPARLPSIIGMLQDITQREQAMTERADLEHRIRSAHEANRAKTEFLAHMSHELRTPLNAVLGLSEAMIERVFGELNASQVQTLETVHSSGRHLLDLINDVLDIARLESGNLAIDLEQSNLRPLIDESTTLMANTFSARHQRLVIELAPSLPPAEIDRRRMRQLVMNLLGNASKFSPENSTITLRVTSDCVRRTVSIAVADMGSGIAPEDRTRIFEPFVTIAPLLTRSHDGVGLGLALAKRIAELHGGQLIVESELGVGSTFTLVLCVSAAYIEPPRRHSPVTPRPGTVLLAEDNEATVLAVRTYLESRGFGIRVVRDGATALTAAACDDVVLVLMDVQLPGLDGLEVTRRLRSGSFAKPIIALTAYAMPEDESRCLDAGMSAYLSKPVRLRKLADTIDRLLEVR